MAKSGRHIHVNLVSNVNRVDYYSIFIRLKLNMRGNPNIIFEMIETKLLTLPLQKKRKNG